MGKLLIGHFGEPPQAESIAITLRDCHQRLGLKPSDFVSSEEPDFFKKARRAVGKYLVFQADLNEVKEAAVWKAGYYLLPLSATDVLNLFNKQEITRGGGAVRRPMEVESKETPPPDVMERASRWADQSQPLLFHCHCPQLLLKLDAPMLFRRHWKVRLTCRKRCQPPVKGDI
jgi:hypothetical protein